MRIISGIHKKRRLYTVPGRSTRPTTDFNRELIFSTWQDYEGKKVLDLYAGTGSFGLEALSRGARWVDFVEFASPAIAVLLANIELLSCGNECHIYRKKVMSFLQNCEESYDIIFMDPPYDKNLINPDLASIYERNILSSEGVIIVEHSALEKIKSDYQDRIIREKTGNTTRFTILGHGIPG
ncbi:MAG TPA: 16S rRNA (guanine(966)-N(2))-methyltransferase RsmD [Candidatus Cloacimonadota bacterium]|nr:16S rRNA (guanine(966)-N(2))-methyltransferase RsmD [Candidatus Cloacimonadota bacterium]